MVMDPVLQDFSNMPDGLIHGDFFSARNNFPNGYSLGDTQPCSLQDPHLFFNNDPVNNSMHNGYTYIDGNNPMNNSMHNSYHYLDRNYPMNNTCISSVATAPVSNQALSSTTSPEEDSEILSDANLNYISQMLLEEDIDEKVNTYHEQAALRAAEKPFYDILNEKYTPDDDQPSIDSNSTVDNNHGDNHTGWSDDSPECYWKEVNLIPMDHSSVTSIRSSSVSSDYSSKSLRSSSAGSFDCSSKRPFGSSNIFSNAIETGKGQHTGLAGFPNPFADSQSAWQFKKGLEAAKKFLPSENKLVIDVDATGTSLPQAAKAESRLVMVKAEKEEHDYSFYGSKGRKNPNGENLDLQEGRSIKQFAVSFEDTLRSEMFDNVLLCNKDRCGKAEEELREALKNEKMRFSQNVQTKGSNAGKVRGKKQTKKEVVDLRTLLTLCAQAVAADDRRSASELLKQIRQHSSPFGDGSQRLANCFADGLEARLAGTGSQIYQSLVAKRTTATDILKAYQLYLAACPFKKISHFFANQTIVNVVEKASRVHIVDFGIYFGFQWPNLIQRLSNRPGGPPRLRITGVDVPQPGFRPTERIEETGRRLAEYAHGFNVPFEYNSIASKWENIRIEDLRIEKDEILIVNCLYRFRNLVDETVVVDSPRNKVLNTIRKMNPEVFIHGIVNGSYSAPFFVTRFREALFHFSALFDMLETNVPREDSQRLLIERDLFGREAMNVIACEGSERVERPETYKQWHARYLRAGFAQLPLDPEIMKKARDRVKSSYHKDFVVDEDSRWLLQGWKGRIIYAISTWKPNSDL